MIYSAPLLMWTIATLLFIPHSTQAFSFFYISTQIPVFISKLSKQTIFLEKLNLIAIFQTISWRK